MAETSTFTDREIIECDWVVLPSWGSLHYTDSELEEGTMGDGVTSCGRKGYLCVPGIFTRMGAMRCGRCCDALGYPRGKGSPKNDDACRKVLDERLAAVTFRSDAQEEA